MPKTWNEKLNIDREPEVGPSVRKIDGFPPGSMMLVPTPREVRDYVMALKPGTKSSIPEMRATLAKQFGAEVTCPMVSGIFARIVSEAALDDHRAGMPLDKITPFWRLVDPKTTLAKRLTCGADFIDRQRKSEGI